MSVKHVFTNNVADGSDPTIVRPSDWNSAHQQFVTLSGNTNNASTISGTDIVFEGGNNITLKATGSTIVFSGANTVAQSVQPAVNAFGITNTGNTAGNSGTSSGISFVLAGTNNITASQSTTAGGPNTIWISGPTTVAQTVQTQNVVVPSAGTQSATSGTVIFSNSNGISFGMSNSSVITASYTVPNVPAQTVQPAVNAFGVSNTGNTAGNTGTSSGISFVIAGTNNITASQSTTAGGPNTIWLSGPTTVAQTVQSAIKAFGASNTGNTAGNTGVSTGIDWVVAGTNNITISQSTAGGGPNTLWVSGPTTVAQTVQPAVNAAAGTQTATSGTVKFVDSNGIVFGMSGSTQITASYTVPTQTNQSAIKGFGASNTGNTAGNTGISTGIDWVVAGSNNITISQSTAGGGPNTIWVSGPTTVAQTNQSAIKGFGVSNTGTTAGNTGLSTGIDWVIAASGNITASQSTVGGGPNTVWLSVPNVIAQTVESQTFGVSNLGNTLGTSGVASGGQVRFILVGSSNITLSQSINGASGTITINAANQTVQPAINAFGVSNTGNTAGNTGTSSGISFVVAGTNNITISQSTAGGGPNTVWISGPTTVAQTNQSAIKGFGVSNTGTTAGNTGLSTGIDWIIAASGNITASQSTVGGGPNTVWLSVPASAAQTVQPAVNAFGVSNTGNTAGNTGTSSGISFVIAGTNNITASQSTTAGGPNTIWLSGPTTVAQTVQSAIKGFGVSNTGTTLGNTGLSTGIDWVIAASGNVTASQSTVGGGPNTVWISVPASAAQTNQSAIKGLGVSNTGTTAGNTGLSTGIDWVIAASGNITASQSTAGGGPNTIWMSVPAQTNQSAIKGIGISNTGNTLGNTGLSTGIDWVIAASGNITASQSTTAGGPNTMWLSVQPGGGAGDGYNIIAANGSTANTTGTIVFSNSNNITFGLTNGSVVTASYSQSIQSAIKGFGASNTGNTAGNTGLSTGIDWVVAGSNNITISQSTAGGGPNTIWVSGPTTVAQTNQSAIKGFGASNTGNTAGNTGLSTGIDWVIAGSNSITISQSTAAGGPNTIWVSGPTVATSLTAINISASNTNTNLSNLVFSNSNGISFGLNGSTITASIAPAPVRSEIEVIQGERLTTVRNFSETIFSNRMIFQPFWVDGTGVQPKTIQLIISGAPNTTATHVATTSIGLYSMVNSSQMSLFGTASAGISQNVAANSTVYAGPRIVQLTGMTGTMTTEGRWMLAMLVTMSAGGNASFNNMALYGGDNVPQLSGFIIGNTTSATASNSYLFNWWGVQNTTTNALPSTVALSQVAGGNSASLIDFYAVIKGF
jgi:hypothetical protein